MNAPIVRVPFLVALLLTCMGFLSCTGGGGDRLLVFAASSLTDSMQLLAERYQEHTGVRVDLSFGSSGRLAQQVSRGAPADAFVSAGTQPVDRLEDEGLVAAGSRRPLLTNRLVLVTRSGDTSGISSLEELVQTAGMLAIADPELAPAGFYAREALNYLGLWDAFHPRLVYGTNVRTTLGYVESGNVAAALVYHTDPAIDDGVRVASTLPQEAHPPIVYPAVVIARSERQGEAAAFIDFLAGDEAAGLFRQIGFEPVAAKE